MTYVELLSQLEKLGTEQNRKVYMRHGSGQNTFGVSFQELRKMAKGLGCDHDIALALWDSEIIDAQCLATMIMNPDHLDFKTTDMWLKKLTYYLVVGLLAGVVAKTSFAKTALKKWTASKKEFVKEGGYSLLSHMLKDGVDLDEDDLAQYLEKIESEIHSSPNRARSAMNNALIAIGVYKPALTQKAVAAAKRIGKVTVDHGKTSCKTPDAAAYIEKTLNRKKTRARKK